VAPKIGQNQPITRRQLFGNRKPEFMMNRKRVQKDHRRAIAECPVDNLGIAAAYALRGNIRHAEKGIDSLLILNC
jgi:hypothetical protein